MSGVAREPARAWNAVLASAPAGIRRAAEAAQATHLWIGDHLHEGGANGRVKGIAAARQKLRSHLGRHRLRRNHDAPHYSKVAGSGGEVFEVCGGAHAL